MSEDKKKSVWTMYSAEERAAVDALARGYIDFLSDCKTERESVQEAVRAAEAAGYRDLADIIAEGTQLRAGDKVYAVNMKKAIVLFHIGTEPMEHGMNILGAHIDTCRLDVKQNPLYEDGGLAYFDTHYYGGIKKYQWVTIPLALHGVVVKKDGTTVTITLGEKADDPVFCVTDLLVHLSQEQLEKKAAKVIEGEKLDVLIGYVKQNDAELAAALGRELRSAADIHAAGRELLAQLSAVGVLITRGADGMTLFLADGSATDIPVSDHSEIFDVSGAGDTCVAVMALALAVGVDPVTAARLSNTASGIAVRKRGTATVAWAELHAALTAEGDGHAHT